MPDLHTHTYNRGDANIDPDVFALPNGAATTVSDPIDLAGVDPVLAPFELEAVSPLVDTADLPDAQTLTYDLEHADTSGGTYSVACGAFLVVTGAGGVGAAATTGRVRVASTSKQFVRLSVTKSGAGDASDKDAALKGRF